MSLDGSISGLAAGQVDAPVTIHPSAFPVALPCAAASFLIAAAAGARNGSCNGVWRAPLPLSLRTHAAACPRLPWLRRLCRFYHRRHGRPGGDHLVGSGGCRAMCSPNLACGLSSPRSAPSHAPPRWCSRSPACFAPPRTSRRAVGLAGTLMWHADFRARVPPLHPLCSAGALAARRALHSLD